MFSTGFSFLLSMLSDLFSLVLGINLGGVSVGLIIGGLVVTGFALWFLKLVISKA